MKEKCDICLIEKEVKLKSVGNVGITQFINICLDCEKSIDNKSFWKNDKVAVEYILEQWDDL